MGDYSRALQLSHKASWPEAESARGARSAVLPGTLGVGCLGRKGESGQCQAGGSIPAASTGAKQCYPFSRQFGGDGISPASA